MNTKDLEYIFNHIPYKKNIYHKVVPFRLPDIHINYLKKNNINYKFNQGKSRYQRTIDILRKDNSLITTIKPPRYLTNSRVGYELVKDKFSTENLLEKYNINTVKSEIYMKSDMQKAKTEAFNNRMKSVVIKPLAGTLGKGVMVNVSEQRFEYNWLESTKYIGENGKVVVQEYLDGFEARGTVIEGNLVAITLRVPPYIIGNGKNDIDSLIDIKNIERKKCTVLSRALIKKSIYMKEFLRLSNKNLNDIPANGEYILLGSVSNFSNGGELINITELVDENIKKIALDTIAAIPGLYTGGVDIMMKSFDDENPTVLEVNSFPVIGLAAFPTYGEMTNPSKIYVEAIISKDQFMNKVMSSYKIEQEKEYVINYLKFQKRKDELLNINYKEILNILRRDI